MTLERRLNQETIEQIRAACPNRSLKATCALAGINYDTLYGQMRHGRPIPYSTVRLLSDVLQLPMSFFEAPTERLAVTADVKSTVRKATIENMILAGVQPSIDTMRDWIEQADFALAKIPWVLPLIDLFETLQKYQDIPTPYRIGEKSLSRVYFLLKDEEDYVKKVTTFSSEKKSRLRRSHFLAKSEICYSTTEFIDEEVDGVRVTGRYRRMMFRALCVDGVLRTGVYGTTPKLLG